MCPLTIYSQQGRRSHPWEHKSAHPSIQDSFTALISLRNKSTRSDMTWLHFAVSPLCFLIDLLSAPALSGSLLGSNKPVQCHLGLFYGVFPLPRVFISQRSAWVTPSCCSSLCSKLSFQRGLPWPLYLHVHPFHHFPIPGISSSFYLALLSVFLSIYHLLPLGHLLLS